MSSKRPPARTRTATEPAAGHDAEIYRLASCIADGTPLTRSIACNDIDATEKNAFALLDRVALGFRSAWADDSAHERPALMFRFAGLEVLAKIGEGSYGEVFRAYDPILHQPVALKLLKADSGLLSETFLEEARHLARLRHPNILNVYGAAIDNGRAGLWTEFVHGATLRGLLNKQQTFSVDEVRHIGRDACNALAYIHQQGLVHGDIKPDNLMRDDCGRIVMMDFGTARRFDRAHAAAPVYGSLRFLAPEVLRGGAMTAAADIYALGATLFVLLTGAPPYQGRDLDALLREHERPDRAKLHQVRADLPRDLCDAIERALAIDPMQRHAGATAFAAALQTPADTARSTKAKHWAAVALTVCASLAALYTFTRPSPWTARADFFEASSDGYRALKNGDSVRLGDALALEFESTRPAYLYVIDDDGSGTPAVLFPADELATNNPVAPGRLWRLPGKSKSGALRDWQVNRDADKDVLIVLATSSPLTELESAMADWRHAGENAAIPAAPDLRGVYGMVPARRPRLTSNARLDQIIGDLDHAPAQNPARYWRFSFPHGVSR